MASFAAMRIIIRYFFRTLRVILTPFLLLGDKLTKPKSMERDPAEQAQVDAETSELALYQFNACPYCVKVRRAMHRLALNIELRDAQSDRENRDELIAGGGRPQVPCLRIPHADGSVEWMYESGDIIRYLEERFGKNSRRPAD